MIQRNLAQIYIFYEGELNMVTIKNLFENDDVKVIEKKGNISVVEFQRDVSVNKYSAINEYFASKMNVRRRQALVELNNSEFITSAGAMQWLVGNIESKTDVKGVGDFLGKAIKGSVTKESAAKPKYYGTGLLALEPTYSYILVEDVGEWNGGMVLEDGMFMACDGNIKTNVVMRSNLSSAVLGAEGLFNLKLDGRGLAILESPVPREELIEINLENDQIKIDGNMAVAWSGTLNFTVEKSTRSLIGSAIAGEGFVNVYRGTGKLLMAPIRPETVSNILDYKTRVKV